MLSFSDKQSTTCNCRERVFPGNTLEEEVITWELVIFQLNIPILGGIFNWM